MPLSPESLRTPSQRFSAQALRDQHRDMQLAFADPTHPPSEQARLQRNLTATRRLMQIAQSQAHAQQHMAGAAAMQFQPPGLIDMSRKSHEVLAAENNMLKGQVSALQAALVEQAGEKDRLNQCLMAAEQQSADTHRVNGELDAQVVSAIREIAILKHECKELRAARDIAEQDFHHKYERLKKLKADLQLQLEQQNEQIRKLKRQNRELKTQNILVETERFAQDMHQSEIENMSMQLDSSTQEIRNLRRELTEIRKARVDADSSMMSLQDTSMAHGLCSPSKPVLDETFSADGALLAGLTPVESFPVRRQETAKATVDAQTMTDEDARTPRPMPHEQLSARSDAATQVELCAHGHELEYDSVSAVDTTVAADSPEPQLADLGLPKAAAYDSDPQPSAKTDAAAAANDAALVAHLRAKCDELTKIGTEMALYMDEQAEQIGELTKARNLLAKENADMAQDIKAFELLMRRRFSNPDPSQSRAGAAAPCGARACDEAPTTSSANQCEMRVAELEDEVKALSLYITKILAKLMESDHLEAVLTLDETRPRSHSAHHRYSATGAIGGPLHGHRRAPSGKLSMRDLTRGPRSRQPSGSGLTGDQSADQTPSGCSTPASTRSSSFMIPTGKLFAQLQQNLSKLVTISTDTIAERFSMGATLKDPQHGDGHQEHIGANSHLVGAQFDASKPAAMSGESLALPGSGATTSAGGTPTCSPSRKQAAGRSPTLPRLMTASRRSSVATPERACYSAPLAFEHLSRPGDLEWLESLYSRLRGGSEGDDCQQDAAA
ncbi:hypothetical protein HK105_208818 [Polyrhizophydium stewartii]|uniref:Uncharacterized protein n=1 Tax=Polyrhizophydium stewartii TaxID=2732419 RepID=A0ABR4MWS5_9FUNG|nr:hypothetical protein HK105_002082 [Polyrhizophydium stewartii]